MKIIFIGCVYFSEIMLKTLIEFKTFRHPYIKTLLMYECLSETNFAPALHEKVFIPNYFVNISNFMNIKIELMKVYQSEILNHPFPRSEESIKSLAILRGSVSGFKFAEAFQLLKHIED